MCLSVSVKRDKAENKLICVNPNHKAEFNPVAPSGRMILCKAVTIPGGGGTKTFRAIYMYIKNIGVGTEY